MAIRRMISKKIADTDAFLDMPLSSQVLYFHLLIRADDDGFVSNPKKIIRMLGAQEDDYKILLVKKFIIQFDSGVCVIKHWLIHNLIRSDRYTETQWVKEKEMLKIDKKTKKYSLSKPNNNNVIPNGNQMAPQYRIGKDSIGKDNTLQAEPAEIFNSNEYIQKMLTNKSKHIILVGEYFKSRGNEFPSLKAIQTEIKRWVKVASEIVEYSEDQQIMAFNYVRNKFPEEWNLSTVAKYINNPIINGN